MLENIIGWIVAAVVMAAALFLGLRGRAALPPVGKTAEQRAEEKKEEVERGVQETREGLQKKSAEELARLFNKNAAERKEKTGGGV